MAARPAVDDGRGAGEPDDDQREVEDEVADDSTPSAS
jgi:hypothetical protein